MKENTRKKIVKERKRRGLTQEDIAKLVNVSPKTISNYEAGVTEPKIADFKKICKVLDMDPKDWI